MEFEGTAFRYGRDIDTDVIIPARYLNTSDPAELARAVSRILDDPELRRTLAERGRAYVERFRMEVVGPQMADLYGRLSE